MLNQLKIAGLLLCSFLFAGCPEKESINTEEIPIDDSILNAGSDFELYYSNSGGMSPESEHIYICNDSASWKYGRYNKETIITWIPGSKDIAKIINVLAENKYLKIESREEEEVYDRGGVRMTIINNGVKKELDNSGRTFVKDQWQENFRAIRDYIKTYVKSEVDKQLIKVPFVKDVSLGMNSEPVKVWLNGQLFYSTFESNVKPIDSITAYPGRNEFTWTIYYADSVKYNNDPVYRFGGQDIFEATKDATEIILKREDQEILMDVR